MCGLKYWVFFVVVVLGVSGENSCLSEEKNTVRTRLTNHPYDEEWIIWVRGQVRRCDEIISKAKAESSLRDLEEAVVMLEVLDMVSDHVEIRGVLELQKVASWRDEMIEVYEEASERSKLSVKKAGKRKSENAKPSRFVEDVRQLLDSLNEKVGRGIGDAGNTNTESN